MKITWFGGTTLRIYLGGEIIVIDADGSPEGVDRGELLAGAGRVVGLGDGSVAAIDPAGWKPKAAAREIDLADSAPVEIAEIGGGTLLVSGAGEPPLVVLGSGQPPRFGRWADGAVIVLTAARESLVAEATVLLDVARPRLIALAMDDERLDDAVAALEEHLGGAGLVSLEPGLALEV